MNEAAHSRHGTLPLELAQALDRLCDRFERAWQAAAADSPQPRLEDYVAQVAEELRSHLLRELIPLDLEYRRHHGERPRADDYQRRFPELDPAWLAGQLTEPPAQEAEPAAPSTPAPAREGTQRLRCPQCQSPIQLADGHGDVVLCPGCGSSFHIRDARQTTTSQGMRQVGKFQLLERVGLGAFGAVWKARDTELERIVALKIPHTGLLTSDTDLERFHREARAAAQLRHPGVVTVHEVQTLDGLPTIVADFIHGVTLKDLLEVRRLTFREAATLIAEVAEALDYAHQMGLVHRDLKPANIMVESPRLRFDGNGAPGEEAVPEPDRIGRPLVMDFGLALRDEAEITMTTDGLVLGTPAYMSPEQAAGYSHRADRRSDVYSLGVILYQLLTGELPFRGSKAMLLHQVQHEEPRPPRKVNDKIPRDLETVCLKAMAKAPEGRYGRAGKLAEDLRRYLRGEPVRARPVGRAERLGRWCRRNPLVAGLLAAVAMSLLAGAALSVAFGVRANEKAEEARENERRADAKAEEARANLYVAHVNLAQAYWNEESAAAARDLVDYYRQPGATQRDLRGWEWHYLDRLTHPELRTMEGYQEQIQGVVFSPDGSRLASAGKDGTVRLWVVASGQILHTLRGHQGSVEGVAFSPDGARLASAGKDGTVRLWDVASGQALHTLAGHQGAVWNVVFSPDGARLASAGQDGTVHLWDVTDGQALHNLAGHRGMVTSVVFSPNSARLASAGQDGRVRLWDVAGGRPLPTLVGHRSRVTTVVFSPDGTRLASASWDGTVRLWDAASGQTRLVLAGHRGSVFRVVFSPDGARLASTGADGTVRLWDAAGGQALYTFAGHRGLPLSVVFSPDGSRLASAGMDGTVRLWDPANGQALLTLAGPCRGQITHVVFSPDSARLASAGQDGTVQLWDVAGGQALHNLAGHRGMVTSVVFSPNSARLASAGQDGRVRLWDADAGQALQTLAGHRGPVGSVVFSADGSRLASAGQDGRVRLWDADDGRVLQTLEGRQGKTAQRVVFSPDGQRLAYAGPNGTLRLWDVAGGPVALHTLAGHRGSVLSVVFSPDGSRLASAGEDGTVRLWDAVGGQPLHTLMGHPERASISVAFSPDGARLASGGQDGTVRVWDTSDGEARLTLKGHQGGIDRVVFSPDGSRLASAGEDATVRLWLAGDGQALHTLMGHRGRVTDVVFSADGSRLASAGNDGTVRLWAVVGGQALQTLTGHRGWIFSVVFSPDGSRLASAGEDGTVRLWDGRPLTPALRVEGEAQGLVAFLREQPLLNAEIVQRLRADAAISEPVRQQALHMVELVRDDSERLNTTAWNVVRGLGRSPALYRQALHAAEVACRTPPENGLVLNTLGVAQYRVGRYADAVKTLSRSRALNMAPARKALLQDFGSVMISPWQAPRTRFWAHAQPADVAFLALAHARLGHDDEARVYRAWLRYLLRYDRWAQDDEARGFWREVETVMPAGGAAVQK